MPSSTDTLLHMFEFRLKWRRQAFAIRKLMYFVMTGSVWSCRRSKDALMSSEHWNFRRNSQLRKLNDMKNVHATSLYALLQIKILSSRCWQVEAAWVVHKGWVTRTTPEIGSYSSNAMSCKLSLTQSSSVSCRRGRTMVATFCWRIHALDAELEWAAMWHRQHNSCNRIR